jgi:hypothetical protein
VNWQTSEVRITSSCSMRRILLTKWKALFLIVALLAVAGIAWWVTRGPREPVYQGKPLSWWFTTGLDGSVTTTPRRLTAAELHSLGPEAVQWLGHMASQTSIWDLREPSATPDLPGQILWWLRDGFFRRSASRFINVRFESICALKELGPEAASAILSLLAAVRQSDSDASDIAAQALIEMDSISRPAVIEAIRHADPRSKHKLLDALDLRFLPNRQPIRPEEFAEIVGILISLTYHSDPDVAQAARERFNGCIDLWKDQPPSVDGIRLVAETLPKRTDRERRDIARFLSRFEAQGSPAIPALAALAETSDKFTRVDILGALAILDPDNSRWPTELYKLADSPDKPLAEAAERALIHALK